MPKPSAGKTFYANRVKAREIKAEKVKKLAEKKKKVLGILMQLKAEGKPTEILGWKLDDQDNLISIPLPDSLRKGIEQYKEGKIKDLEPEFLKTEE